MYISIDIYRYLYLVTHRSGREASRFDCTANATYGEKEENSNRPG